MRFTGTAEGWHGALSDAAPAFAIGIDAILHVLDWIPVRLATN